jgi:hypothetical protein
MRSERWPFEAIPTKSSKTPSQSMAGCSGVPVIPAMQRLTSGGFQFQVSLGKKLMTPQLNRRSWIWWYRPVNPSTIGSINRRIIVQVCPGTKQDPASKITRAERLEIWPKWYSAVK